MEGRKGYQEKTEEEQWMKYRSIKEGLNEALKALKLAIGRGRDWSEMDKVRWDGEHATASEAQVMMKASMEEGSSMIQREGVKQIERMRAVDGKYKQEAKTQQMDGGIVDRMSRQLKDMEDNERISGKMMTRNSRKGSDIGEGDDILLGGKKGIVI